MTTTVDTAREAELRELLAKATPGPWAVERQELDADFSDEDQEQAFPECVGPLWLAPGASHDEPPQIEADVALVIAAVNALPDLLAALDAARTERDAALSLDCVSMRMPIVEFTALRDERDRLAAALAEVTTGGRWYAVTLDGIEECDTAEGAQSAAQEAIDHALGDEWNESVEGVEWGRLVPVQQVEQYDYREPVDGKTPDGDDWPNAEWSFMCNYRLAPAVLAARQAAPPDAQGVVEHVRPATSEEP